MGLYPRRMHMRQIVFQRSALETGLVATLRGIKNALPGTTIPADFPAREALLAADYTALEDLGTPPFDDWTRTRLAQELVLSGLSDSDAALVAAYTWTLP